VKLPIRIWLRHPVEFMGARSVTVDAVLTAIMILNECVTEVIHAAFCPRMVARGVVMKPDDSTVTPARRVVERCALRRTARTLWWFCVSTGSRAAFMNAE
jgi:hypothetical protein